MDEARANLARVTIDMFREDMRDHGNVSVARDRAVYAASVSETGRQLGARDSYHISTEAIIQYRQRSRDLPHDQARESAVRDVFLPGQWRGMDVKNYARSVVDSVESNPGSKHRVIYAHASFAAEQGRAKEVDAGKLASAVVRRHEELTSKGMSSQEAKEQVAQEMSRRFDSRARDTQAKERGRSAGMEI